jgi:tRNA-specific 2-thiouridylase
MDKFVNTYLDGGTPNPCIDCNRYLKFGDFLLRAKLLGYEYIATGHYVTKVRDEKTGRWLLKRSADRKKDQTYVLYSLTQDQLEHSLFPVGEMNKADIRTIADENSLVNAAKPDSQDICFIPDGDYASFITSRCGKQPCGDIVLTSGEKLGTHKGLIHYTIGQRRGVGVSYTEPIFVIQKDIAGNRLILGTPDKLLRTSLTASDVNMLTTDELNSPIKCTACTRYHQQDMPCTVTPIGERRVRVDFEQPHKAICKGQAVVFYDGDYLIGGGTIE